jgi:hypothetical protein
MADKKNIDFPHGRKYINDEKAFLPTEQKQYVAYICKPEQNGEMVVISSVTGQLCKASLQKVIKEFCLPGGFGLGAYLKRTYAEKPLVFDWLKVQYVPKAERFYALYIPQEEQFTFISASGKTHAVNKHDKGGSFIVCSDLRGKPDLTDMQVIRTDIFIRTYTLRGNLAAFKDYKKAVPATPKPKRNANSFRYIRYTYKKNENGMFNIYSKQQLTDDIPDWITATLRDV